KYRVVYTDHQRLELEKEFHYSRYITIRRKSELAANLGLTERQVCRSSASAQVTGPRVGLSGCHEDTGVTKKEQRGCLPNYRHNTTQCTLPYC
ncbi:Homeobox protein CDX-1 (Fragment), partial [Lemmus lemmus]